MRNYTVIVAVFDTFDAVKFQNLCFQRLGVKPLYVIDSAAAPEAKTTLDALGYTNAPTFTTQGYIESGYKQLVDLSPTPWVLRIDPDEIPSQAMLDFADTVVEAGGTNSIGNFPRFECFVRDGALYTPNDRRWEANYFRQFRLFNKDTISFDTSANSGGINIRNCIMVGGIDQSARLWHTSRVFRTPEEVAALETNPRAPQLDQATAPATAVTDTFLTTAYADWLKSKI